MFRLGTLKMNLGCSASTLAEKSLNSFLGLKPTEDAQVLSLGVGTARLEESAEAHA